MDKELFDFRYELLKAGFQYDVSDSKYLLETAKACAKTYGVAAGGGVALATATAGAVAVPGVGEVPGYVIGFLAGMVGGTLMCVTQRASIKRELDKLLEDPAP